MVAYSCSSIVFFCLPKKRRDHNFEACHIFGTGDITARSSFDDLGNRAFFGRTVKAHSRIGTFHFAEGPVHVSTSFANSFLFKLHSQACRDSYSAALRLREHSFSYAAREVFLSRVSDRCSLRFHDWLIGKRAEVKPFRRLPHCTAKDRIPTSEAEKYLDSPYKISKRGKKGVQSLETSLSSVRGVQSPQPTFLNAHPFDKQHEVSDYGVIQPLGNRSFPFPPEKLYQDSWIYSTFWHAFPLYVLWFTLQCLVKILHCILHNYPVRKSDFERYGRIYSENLTGQHVLKDMLSIITKSKSKHVPNTFSVVRTNPVNLSVSASEFYELLTTGASLLLSKILSSLGICFWSKSPHNSIPLAMLGWIARVGKNHGPSFISLIGAGYWLQGFRCFPWLAVSFYFKDRLQVDPGTLQFVQTTMTLPFLAKPIYGIVSDAVYIHGAHRLPYLIIGGVLQALSWGLILVHPSARSSVGFFAAILTFSNIGAAVAEVANDALVAESGKRKGAIPGELQSFAWLSSAFGNLLGCLLASFALNRVEFEVIFFIFLVLLVFQLLNCISIREQSFGLGSSSRKKDSELRKEEIYYPSASINTCHQQSKGLTLSMGKDVLVTEWDLHTDKKHTSMVSQVQVLVKLVQKQEILHPLMWFMGSYAVIPALGGSIFYYQSEFLKINASFLGLAKMVGQVGLLAGSFAYNKVLKDIPLRKLVVSVQVLLSIFMLSDLVLVKRVNLQLGIPDEYYVLGASALVEGINQFKILPLMVLLAKLCPSGSEGSLFAFFTSCLCLASILSGYFGTALASCLHISSDNFTHLPVGIFIQSMAALLPILWVRYLPDDTTKAMVKKKVEKVL